MHPLDRILLSPVAHRLLIVGIVLTAGASSRMGTPKALLHLHGRSFLGQLVDALATGGCDRVITVVGADRQEGSDQIRRTAVEAGAEVVVNPDPESEQLDSIRIALATVPEVDGAVITPVDAPAIGSSTVAAILEMARKGAVVVVPTFEGRRGHPIYFGGAALEDLRNADLEEGARTVTRLHVEKLVEVPVRDRHILLDIDTPADLERAREDSK